MKRANTYKGRLGWQSEFSHRYACWANNHNGWAKAKKSNKRLAKRRLKDELRKELVYSISDKQVGNERKENFMKREDFVFDHMDDEYEDYWFKVVGDTKDELTKKYMEMCMVSVTEVVYSNKEQALGVKRLFPFNYDVIMPDDSELRDMLVSLVAEQNS